jgi:hypothetical protein
VFYPIPISLLLLINLLDSKGAKLYNEQHTVDITESRYSRCVLVPADWFPRLEPPVYNQNKAIRDWQYIPSESSPLISD